MPLGPTNPSPVTSLGLIRRLKGAISVAFPSMIVTLSSTGVSPASYTNANITVGADGRISAASNGSGSSGTVASSTIGTVGVYTGATTVTGNAQFTFATASNVSTVALGDGTTNAGALTLSKGNGTAVPVLTIGGSSSGTLLLQAAAAAGSAIVWTGPTVTTLEPTAQPAVSGQVMVSTTAGQRSFIAGVIATANNIQLGVSGTAGSVTIFSGTSTNSSAITTAAGAANVSLVLPGQATTMPATNAAVSGEVMVGSSAGVQSYVPGVVATSSNVTIGVASTTAGTLTLEGATSGSSVLQAPATAGAGIITTLAGVATQLYTAQPVANGEVSVGSTTGAMSYVGGVIATSNTLTLGVNTSAAGSLVIEGGTSGSVAISTPLIAGTGTTFVLPSVNKTFPTVQASTNWMVEVVNSSGVGTYRPLPIDYLAYACYGGL